LNPINLETLTMGADPFWNTATGATAQEAFDNATAHARYMHGHGGYSGTLAEKRKFVMVPVPAGHEPLAYARTLHEGDDSPGDDKWGPAACVQIGPGEYLFFGWASS
jgi:hypothetical protein